MSMKDGYFIPACGGTEKPFTMQGRELLYCWNPVTKEHAYIDLKTDLILSDEEVNELFFA